MSFLKTKPCLSGLQADRSECELNPAARATCVLCKAAVHKLQPLSDDGQPLPSQEDERAGRGAWEEAHGGVVRLYLPLRPPEGGPTQGTTHPPMRSRS